MIGPTGAVRVMMATRPVDFRKGMDGLAALVRDTMGAEPRSYLANVISRIVQGHLNSRLDDLLPWAYRPTQALKAVA